MATTALFNFPYITELDPATEGTNRTVFTLHHPAPPRAWNLMWIMAGGVVEVYAASADIDAFPNKVRPTVKSAIGRHVDELIKMPRLDWDIGSLAAFPKHTTEVMVMARKVRVLVIPTVLWAPESDTRH